MSSLLIGSKNNSNSIPRKAQNIMIGRKQSFSKLLTGGLKDSDKDGIPNRFDCAPFNRRQHANIPSALMAQRPAPLPQKAQTLAPISVEKPGSLPEQRITEAEIESIKALEQQTAYEQQYVEAYNQVIKHYNRGMLWAVAGFGTGLQQEIAKKLIKEGYSPAAGGQLSQEMQAQRNLAIKEVKSTPGVEIKGSTILFEGKPITLSKALEMKYQQEQPVQVTTTEVKAPTNEPTYTTGTFTKAPTTAQKYQQQVQQSGYIKGTLKFVGSQLQELEARRQEKTGDYYQSEAKITAAGLTPNIVYATPYAGAALLVAGGAEELGTSAGRERIKVKAEELEKAGYSGTVAKTIAYGQPAAEVGLGLVGFKSEVSATQARIAAKSPKTEFIAQEVPKGDYSEVSVFSRTTIGKKSTLGVSQQRVKTVGDKSFGVARGYIAEEGRFTKEAIKKGEVKPYLSVGASKQVGEAAYYRPTNGLQIGRDIGQGVVSKTISKIGKEEPVKQKVIGGFKRIGETETFSFIGGTPRTTRVYKEGRITQTAKPSITGLILKSEKETPEEVFFEPVSSGISPQVQESVTSQLSTLVSTSKAQVLEQVPKPLKVSFGVPIVSAKTEQIAIAKPIVQEQTLKQEPQIVGKMFEPLEITKQDSRAIQFEGLSFKVKQTPKSKLKDKVVEKYIQPSMVSPKLRDEQISRTFQSPSFRQDQQQATRQTTPTITGNLIFPGEPVPPTGRTSTIIFPDLKKKKKSKEQPYDAYALVDSTKGRARYIQVADNVTREQALGFGARFVDQSNLSAQFKVTPDKGELNDKPNNYWNQLGYKFRNYLQKKGTKIQQSNKFIEKRKYRLDSPQEKGQIQRARASSLLYGRK